MPQTISVASNRLPCKDCMHGVMVQASQGRVGAFPDAPHFAIKCAYRQLTHCTSRSFLSARSLVGDRALSLFEMFFKVWLH